MDSPITSQQHQRLDSLPGFRMCKDLQSNYIYSNRQNAELIGLRHPEEAVGMTDLDLPCGAVECAHLFRAQDREVIHTGRSLHTLDIHCYAGNTWRTVLGIKAPLFDAEQNIAGIIVHGHELDTRWVLELGALLNKIAYSPKSEVDLLANHTSYTIGRALPGPKLSQRQQEILFLLLHGRTVRCIGEFLHISTRTVEWHVHTLKEKFAVLSKRELIDKTVEQGHLHNLPPGLCKRELSIVLRED